MALATLSIDLVAQLASLQQGLDKAGRLAEKQAQQIESSFSGMKVAAAGIGAALAGAFSVAGVVSFVRATVDGLDRLNDLSDATGASIENLSALEDIAARTGTSMDTVADAVVKLNKTLADASKPGSDAANALAALGLNAEALKRLDPAEALRQVSVALAGFADNGNKARLVQELFGKSVQQVAPLLKDLAEAGQLNATVTTEQAKAAEAFNKQLFAMGKNAVDVAREVSGPLIGALNKFFQELANARTAYGSLTAGVVDNFRFGGTGNINGDLLKAAREIAQINTTIANADAGKTKPLFTDQRKALVEERDLLEKRSAFLRLQQQMEGAGGGRGVVNPGLPGLPGVAAPAPPPPARLRPDAPKPKAFISNSFNQDDINALQALGDTDVAKIRELESALTGLFTLQRETRGDAGVVAAIAKVRAELEAFSPEAKAAAEAKRQLDAILAQTPSAKLDVVLSDVRLLNQELKEGRIDVELWAEAVRVSTAKLPEAVQEPLEKINEFTRQAASNIQDALGDSLLSAFDGNAGRVEDIWKNMLKRLVAQAAAAQLGKALLGDSYGTTGQIGGGIGELFKFFSSFGGARADGGPVQAGRPYLVGERGPEIVVPRSAGTVLPNGTGLGRSGSQFTVVVQGDASENTIRLIQAAQAQFEARMMSRR